MDVFEYIEMFIKMFEKIFLKHQNKKVVEEYRINKNNLIKEFETKTEKEIDKIEADIKDFEERFKDYKSAGVNTDNIVAKIDKLNTEHEKQKKKLNDIKRLKD